MNEQARRLADALRELYAQVKGECPSLLNEDSGGDAKLDIEIQDLLAAYDAQPDAEDEANQLVLALRDRIKEQSLQTQEVALKLAAVRPNLEGPDVPSALDQLIDGYEKQLARIAELESEWVPVWVPVGERLPETTRDVLAFDGDYMVAWYSDGRWRSDTVGIAVITHWRELPPAPEARP